MPDKMIKLLKLIEDYLWYNEKGDNIVVIPEDDFIKNDLSIEDVTIGFQALTNKKIIEDCHIEDRIYHSYPTSYEEKIKYIELSLPLSGIVSEKVLGTPLYFIKIKDKKKLIEISKEIQKSDISQDKKEIKFDSLNGVITYGKEQYKIHSDIKLALMKKLWEEREEIQTELNGQEKIIKKGMLWPKQAIATNIEKDPDKTHQAIKDLNRIFIRRGFPLKIIAANGVQLVVKI